MQNGNNELGLHLMIKLPRFILMRVENWSSVWKDQRALFSTSAGTIWLFVQYWGWQWDSQKKPMEPAKSPREAATLGLIKKIGPLLQTDSDSLNLGPPFQQVLARQQSLRVDVTPTEVSAKANYREVEFSVSCRDFCSLQRMHTLFQCQGASKCKRVRTSTIICSLAKQKYFTESVSVKLMRKVIQIIKYILHEFYSTHMAISSYNVTFC